MNFELNSFLNNLVFLLVQTQIKKGKKEKHFTFYKKNIYVFNLGI
jgi:hypothetical protein